MFDLGTTPIAASAPARSLSSALMAGLAQVRIGFAAGVVVRGVEAVAKFALYALAARRLGVHDAGIFFLALTLTHLLATTGRLGLERAVTRHVAAELAIGARAKARAAAIRGTIGMLLASGVLGGLLALSAGIIARAFFRQPDLVPMLQLVGLTVPIANGAFAAGVVLMGLDRGVAAQMVMNAGVPVLTAGALIAAPLTVSQLILVYGSSFGLCAVAGLLLVVWRWPRVAVAAPSGYLPEDLPGVWASARPLYLVEFGQAFLLSLPVLALGRFATPEAVGIFSVASRLSMLVATVVLSISQVASAGFAHHHRRDDWPQLRHAFSRSWRTSVGLCLPMLIVMVAGATPLLHLLGTHAPAATGVLWILSLGQCAYVLTAGKDMLLTMTGHGAVMRRVMAVQLTVCILLALLLVPPFGIFGAAITGLAQWLIYSLGAAFAVARLLPQMKEGK